ncbi:NAD(P)H-hydrate dehydratase [Shimia ponticola]|uniref:NAD(P)H-hydrate dehydratase n=1 Tax=Shimia ponticola TaxID=2582893 RepID=UPI0011BEC3F0|nr:NAD(P)H-hydrate dehydratase [Shimia ponticola]
MTEVLTAAQMRAIEVLAMDSGAVTGLELMERAGRGVVAAIFDHWPDFAPNEWKACTRKRGASPSRSPELFAKDEERDVAPGRMATVLCGPGNNGGDGFVVARLLHGLGWTVQVYLLGDPDSLPAHARANYEAWIAIGSVCHASEDVPGLIEAACSGALLVDGGFGGGLSRPVTGAFEALAEPSVQGKLQANGVRRVAVDVPTGLCADSGRVVGSAVLPADLTVTFQTLRLGHLLGDGPDHCGAVHVVDIGAPVPVGVGVSQAAPDKELLAKRSGHKFDHGHALVVTGGMAKTGAARLSAQAALRSGAGLVTVAPPGAAVMECAAHLTAVMVQRCDDATAMADILGDKRINAVCMGPGMGVARASEIIPVAAGAVHGPALVLDADVLTAIAQTSELLPLLPERCVLTPHGGEFARLFPDLAGRLAGEADSGPAYSKVDATRAAAARAGCVVLFKGADTVIATPDGRCVVHATVREASVPWLATAGAGDVLSGMITGLLARGLDPFEAAAQGAWLHTACARKFGPGLIAEDLAETLPSVLRDLGL